MKDEELKYKEIISIIKDNPPVPTNPEALTAHVMGRIEKLSQNRSRQKRLLISGWISAIAATFLICFLLNETLFSPVNQHNTASTAGHEIQTVSDIKLSETASSIPQLTEKDMAAAEKYELLLPWIKNKRETRAKRMQIRIDFLIHTNY